MPSHASEAIVEALLLRIVAARKKAGMSQERLAELSGVDLGVISRAEHLHRIPGMAAILDLVLALDLDPSKLLAQSVKEVASKPGK